MKHAAKDQEQARRYLFVLELEPGASSQDVKSAYRELCLIWHPDKNPERVMVRATRKLQQLNEAYAWLTEHAALLETLVPSQDKHVNDKQDHQQKKTEAPIHQEKRTRQQYHLRNTPLNVSVNAYQKVFRLNQGGRPLTYIQNAYEDRDQVVVDHATGLMWQKSGSSSVTYREGRAYIKQVNNHTFAGSNTWRLPTIPELISLLEPTEKNGILYIDPIFDNTQRYCWSADLEDSSESAWVVYFDGGFVYWNDFYNSGSVRAVRS